MARPKPLANPRKSLLSDSRAMFSRGKSENMRNGADRGQAGEKAGLQIRASRANKGEMKNVS